MIKTDKGLFKQCLQHSYVPVYMQDWYLDVVCGPDPWEVHMLLKDDLVQAFWVACRQVKLSLRYTVNSQLTPYSGLHILDNSLSTADLQPLLKKVHEQYAFIEHDIHYSYMEFFPAVHHKKITFVIDENSVDMAWANMKADYRRKVRRASEQLTIEQLDFAAFRGLLSESFSDKDKTDPYPKELFRQLDEVCRKNKNRSILGAYDSNSKLVGAAYFLTDDKYTYYLGGGHLGDQHSMYLLIWSAIKESISAGRIFDFEGSMIPGVAQFFRGFGGQQVEYPLYSYSSSWMVDKIVDLKKKML